ncbi:MAG: oligosaccharide flippase family protein [Candidatus Brocadiaceae bacterium]|nr:oligosaccharide flippase family protein [Candidatus Brocadiaceae bacterium]
MLKNEIYLSKTSSINQIKLGAIMSYLAIFFNIIAGLVYTPWMIRQIGRADYGLYALAGCFLSYFMMDFGLGSAIARFISKYRAEGRDEDVGGLLGLTTKLYLLIDLCILLTLVVLFFFIENIFLELNMEEIRKFRVIFCITGLFSIVSFPFMPLNSVLIAYERFFMLKLCDLLSKIFTISLIVVALIAGYKLYALVAVQALVGIVLIFIKYLYMFKAITVKVNFSYFNYDLLKQLLGFSVWVSVIGIAQRLLISITPAILGIFSGTDEIATFSIGMTIEAYSWMFASALGGFFLPKVSRLMATDNREEVLSLMIKIGRIQLFVVGIIITGFITLGKQFITLWVGADFKHSYLVVLFLTIPGLITLTQQIAYTMLNVVNKLKYWALLFIVGSLLSIGLSVALSPRYGAIGSSIGIFTALVLCHIIGMNIIYYKVLKLDVGRFFCECHLKIALPLILSLGVGFLINVSIPANSLVAFLPKAGLLAVLYATFMWILGLNRDEKQLIRSFAHKLPFIGNLITL